MLARISKNAIIRSVIPRRAISDNIRCFSRWSHVEMGAKDPILGVAEAFVADPDPEKINVGIGAYRNDDGNPVVLPSVIKAQEHIVSSGMNMEYLPIGGLASFVQKSIGLAYGPESDVITQDRVAAAQSLSGTGALRLSANYFEAQCDVKPVILLPNPTWGNHFPIYEHAGLETQTYRYWDPTTLGLDFDGMIEDLNSQAGPAVVLLHSCAHNPTGVDPTMEQWNAISQVCKDNGHFILFDNAYQGFASGDTDKDIQAVRLFVDDGHDMALCQSFAKNFGLYGQRVGCFSIICADAEEKARVDSQVKIIARAIYSNPPLHGARIVDTILEDPELTKMWAGEIQLMSGRIIEMRALLKQKLADAGSTRNWDHITNQIGMFSFTGVTPEQCDVLTNEHHIYLTRNGRVSMAGVTSKNVEKLAYAFHDVTK